MSLPPFGPGEARRHALQHLLDEREAWRWLLPAELRARLDEDVGRLVRSGCARRYHSASGCPAHDQCDAIGARWEAVFMALCELEWAVGERHPRWRVHALCRGREAPEWNGMGALGTVVAVRDTSPPVVSSVMRHDRAVPPPSLPASAASLRADRLRRVGASIGKLIGRTLHSRVDGGPSIAELRELETQLQRAAGGRAPVGTGPIPDLLRVLLDGDTPELLLVIQRAETP